MLPVVMAELWCATSFSCFLRASILFASQVMDWTTVKNKQIDSTNPFIIAVVICRSNGVFRCVGLALDCPQRSLNKWGLCWRPFAAFIKRELIHAHSSTPHSAQEENTEPKSHRQTWCVANHQSLLQCI